MRRAVCWNNLTASCAAQRRLLLLGGLLALGLAWAYAPTLAGLARCWSDNPQYSHGFLVPVFAAVVLWVRRAQHPGLRFEPSWWGLAWLALASAMRLLAAAFYHEWLDALSLLPALAGVCMLLGGQPALRWAWPAILFLIFMLPAPYQFEVALAHPLQGLATAASTYALQTLGLSAVSEGNVILLRDVHLGVEEACSGLGMLLTFFALSTAVALVLARNWVERLVLFISSIPVALAANVLRITATGVLYVTAGGGVARVVYHDLAGWLMMPLALGLLWLELKFLGRLFVEVKPAGPLPLALPTAIEPAPRSLPEMTVTQTTTT